MRLNRTALTICVVFGMATLQACTTSRGSKVETEEETAMTVEAPAFDADSAYSYVERLVGFGPRVPNSEEHVIAGDWLTAKLKEFGLKPIEQKTVLKAFDGTNLNTRNIFAQFNPEAKKRILFLAHWDCRPWADEDPDETKRTQPVDGANDGASGVGVLLEMARQLSLEKTDKGIDILFVDAEDWGTNNNDESWAMGTRYFMEHPPVAGYRPDYGILLDMVGSADASFGYEYTSAQAAPDLLQAVWGAAGRLGHEQFHAGFGGAVTDDHTELIKYGVPAIDIIDYRTGDGPYGGFDPVWHTTSDNMDNISRKTLGAVGETLLQFLKEQ